MNPDENRVGRFRQGGEQTICYAELPLVNNKDHIVKNLRKLFGLEFVSVLMTRNKFRIVVRRMLFSGE
ncbi:uncharacterized protein METZ01_LOCUS218592 [marine metagenome]|uniref:Uncharacterized protein n=1 Tax=marine metagenome TaxID=408172 RepID=A0A382FRM2_9ZZZZ